MSKIHILERSLPDGSAIADLGTIRAVFHVNLNSQKNANLDVSSVADPVIVASHKPSGRVRSAVLRIGKSVVPAQLDSNHPDFPGTSEATLLSQQDLGEVELHYQIRRDDTAAGIASALDNLYATVEAKAQSLYTQRYANYGTTRNPA